MNKRGVTLIEVLLSMVIVALASIATLTYFAYAKGGVGKTGNRRAALERARQRLEQLMATPISSLPQSDPNLPPDGQPQFWAVCGNPCQLFSAPQNNDKVDVDDLSQQPIESTVRWRDDPSAGTPTTPDVLEFSVKVWFTPNTNIDDDFNRVHIRTLRTP